MASGQELATAYLSLTVSARGINKDIQREMSGAEGIAESTGRRMGSKLADGIKTGAKVAGVAVAALLGTALTKGFGRLSAIENAQASLSGLGNSAEDVSAIMKNALASVKGTAFGMDEAASTAAGAVAAGVKPGKELESVLRLVGDAATIGGSSLGEMGAVFNKVATSNKVQGDVIAQLNDRGIPIVQMLGKQLGVTSEEVTKMASEGKIGFDTFRAAMEEGLGGAALKSGETTAGAFKNMLAALSRIGAGLLGGVFPYFKDVFGGITKLLDGVESKLTPLANAFGKELAGGIMAFGAAWKANDGDITSSGFPGFMERLAFALRQVKDLASGFWAGFTLPPDLKAEFGNELHPVLAFGVRVREMGDKVRDGMSQFWAGLTMDAATRSQFSGQLDGLVSLGATLRGVFDKLRPSFEQLGPPIMALLLALSPAQLLFKSLLPVLPNIAELLGSMATTAAGLGVVVAGVLTGALTVLLPIIMDIVDWAAGLVSAMTDSQSKIDIVTGALVVAGGAFLAFKGYLVATTIATNIHKAATVAVTVATKAWGVATKVAAAGQRLLNLAMKANPIGLVITGITALVAGLVWFFTQTETGKNIVTAAWEGIKGAVQVVADWFQDTVMPIFTAVWDGISGGAIWLYENGIKPAWEGIQSTIRTVSDWFQNTLVPAISAAIDAVGAVFTWLYESAIKPAFDAIGSVFTWLYETIIEPVFSAISTVVGGFYLLARGIFQLVVSVITNVLAPAFTSFWRDIIQPVFTYIGDLFSLWWKGAKAIFDTVVTFLRNTLSAAFTWLKDNVIDPVFSGIMWLITTWWTGAKVIFDAVVGFIRNTLSTAFTWLKDSIINPVFDGIKWVVTTWWTGVKVIFDAVIGFIRNTLSAAFTWLRDNVISPVWNGITDIISGVWNNGVKPVFDALRGFIMDTIPDAFRTGVDAAGKAFDKLRDIAKKPVEFVVNTVINGGLIAAFNKIAGTLPGIDPLPDVSLPAGFARGGILPGYESRKRDTVLTPMRPGEGVLVPEVIRGAGRGLIDTLNAAGNRGVGAVRRLMANGLHPGRATGGLIHPIPGFGINSGFGRNGTDPSHTGADFAAPTGTPVRAAGPGVVSQAAWSNYGGGNEVKVNHPNGLQTWYSHLSSILARLGQSVMAGQTVGRVGSTGNSTGPHLHYTVMRDGRYVDPAGYLAGGGAGGSSGSGGAAPTNPLENALDGLVSKFKDKFPGGGMFADLAIGTGKKIFTDAKDWVTEKLGGIKDTIKNVVAGAGRLVGIGNAGAPTVYDGGGWLEKTGAPQLVHHRKSKPDAVLSNEQWGTMTRIAENSGGSGGGVTINGDVYGATPEQIVSEWDTKQRRAATMHNLRKVMVG